MRDTEMVRLLLDHHSNIEHTDKYGETPLCWAASVGRAEQAALLIEKGANIEHQSSLIEQGSALAQAGLDAEQPLRAGMDDLLRNCMKAVSDDQLDPLDLYKLLTDQLGIYHTVASLIVSGFADVWARRNSLGELPLEQAFAREVSERRQKLKMVQAINSNSAAVSNQPTVLMLTFRQLDLLSAWSDKVLGN